MLFSCATVIFSPTLTYHHADEKSEEEPYLWFVTSASVCAAASFIVTVSETSLRVHKPPRPRIFFEILPSEFPKNEQFACSELKNS